MSSLPEDGISGASADDAGEDVQPANTVGNVSISYQRVNLLIARMRRL